MLVALCIEPAGNLGILDSSDNIDTEILVQDDYFVSLSADRQENSVNLAF